MFIHNFDLSAAQRKERDGYTLLDNRTIRTIGWKSVALLAYLRSHDESFKVHFKKMEKELQISENTRRKMFSDLADIGQLIQTRTRVGKAWEFSVFVFEAPVEENDFLALLPSFLEKGSIILISSKLKEIALKSGLVKLKNDNSEEVLEKNFGNSNFETSNYETSNFEASKSVAYKNKNKEENKKELRKQKEEESEPDGSASRCATLLNTTKEEMDESNEIYMDKTISMNDLTRMDKLASTNLLENDEETKNDENTEVTSNMDNDGLSIVSISTNEESNDTEQNSTISTDSIDSTKKGWASLQNLTFKKRNIPQVDVNEVALNSLVPKDPKNEKPVKQKKRQSKNKVENRVTNPNTSVSSFMGSKLSEQTAIEQQLAHERSRANQLAEANKELNHTMYKRKSVYKQFTDVLAQIQTDYAAYPNIVNCMTSFVTSRYNQQHVMDLPTYTALKDKLATCSPSINDYEEIINNSLCNGWGSFYPLKQGSQINRSKIEIPVDVIQPTISPDLQDLVTHYGAKLDEQGNILNWAEVQERKRCGKTTN